MNMHNNAHDAPSVEDIRSEIFKMRVAIEERGPYLSFGVVVLALMAFSVIIWVAYPHGEGGDVSLSAVPLIRADTTPLRRAPDDPGGMSIPFQDSTVFDRLEEGEPASRVENLLETTAPSDDAIPQAPAAKPEDVPLEGAKSILITEKTAEGDEEKKTVEFIPPKPAAKPKMTSMTATAATTPAPVSGGVLIQLGSLSSREAAETEWARLRKRFPEALSNLSLDIQRVDLGAKGVYYRVRGGRLAAEQARDICARLKTENPGGCILVEQ